MHFQYKPYVSGIIKIEVLSKILQYSCLWSKKYEGGFKLPLAQITPVYPILKYLSTWVAYIFVENEYWSCLILWVASCLIFNQNDFLMQFFLKISTTV